MRDSGRVETVYNFEVEGFHTYFVGEAGVWAHNLCIDMRQLTKLVMKHGKDFQIYKDWSKAMAPVARNVVLQHMANSMKFVGEYRDQVATIYLNAQTGLFVATTYNCFGTLHRRLFTKGQQLRRALETGIIK